MRLLIKAFLIVGLIPVMLVIFVGTNEIIEYTTFGGFVFTTLTLFYVVFCAVGTCVLFKTD